MKKNSPNCNKEYTPVLVRPENDLPKTIREQMFLDELIFGNAFCLKSKDGTYERIDPLKVKLNPETKEFEIQGRR